MNKYIIFKKDEFDDVTDIRALADMKLEGFVLRPTDLFGSAALWNYAHLLSTAVELGTIRRGVLTDEELNRLDRMSEEVAELAEEWQRRGLHTQKVPD